MLNINLIYDELPEGEKRSKTRFVKRTAVRGVIYDKDCLLMVQTKLGDYRFPGGGVQENETHEQALLREIAEETGYVDVTVCSCMGTAFEQNIDWYEGDAYFQMCSYYYICRLNSDRRVQDMAGYGRQNFSCKQEKYERQMQYCGVKVRAREAYETNALIRKEAWEKSRAAGSRYLPKELDGLDRETEALSVIKELWLGKIIAQVYGCGQQMKQAVQNTLTVDKKAGKANFVTSCDKKIQEELKKRLREAVPEAVFVGEEEKEHASPAKGYAFIVDPIDGTTNFMKDYHASSISVGLTLDGKRIAGVVYNPYLEEMFYAQKGMGAYCNGKAIHVSKEPLENGLVIFGTAPYYEEYARLSFDLAYECFSRALDVRRSGSAALDLCNVAAGRAELYFECVLCPWDFVAGALIVEEAGGCVCTLEGEELLLEEKCSVLASNGCETVFLREIFQTQKEKEKGEQAI